LKITERDIFKFVTIPEELETEKVNYIKDNYENFKQIIEDYKHIENQESFDEEYPHKLSKKIVTRIQSDDETDQREIICLPAGNEPKRDSKVKVAAHSQIAKRELRTETFIDEHSELLIKVVTSEKESKIYILPSNNETFKDFTILLLPSNKRIECKNSLEPISIEPLEISEIRVLR
jgi:hypothetical protein